MAHDKKIGTAAATRRDDHEGNGGSTLLPMLVGGLILITVGMTVVAMLV